MGWGEPQGPALDTRDLRPAGRERDAVVPHACELARGDLEGLFEFVARQPSSEERAGWLAFLGLRLGLDQRAGASS